MSPFPSCVHLSSAVIHLFTAVPHPFPRVPHHSPAIIFHLSPIIYHLSLEILNLSLHIVHISSAICPLSCFHFLGLSGSPHLLRWFLTFRQSFIVCSSTVPYLPLAAHFAPAATNLCLLLIGFSSCFRAPSLSFSYS